MASALKRRTDPPQSAAANLRARLPQIEIHGWFHASKFYSFYQTIDTDWNLWAEDSYQETVREQMISSESMLTSVAEFYEEDVSTRVTALLTLIEPLIMLVMAVFVGFVLVSLYLPIFSLADSIRT